MASKQDQIEKYAQDDDPKPLPLCSYCDSIGASHEGGYISVSGEEVRGHFCNKGCFEKWLKIHSLLSSWKKSKKAGAP
jgi:hypothetical protein